MTDRTLFESIITLPGDNSVMIIEGLTILRKYCKVDLIADDKGRVYYKAKLDELLAHNVLEEDITKLRNSSWKIEGEFLTKDL